MEDDTNVTPAQSAVIATDNPQLAQKAVAAAVSRVKAADRSPMRLLPSS